MVEGENEKNGRDGERWVTRSFVAGRSLRLHRGGGGGRLLLLISSIMQTERCGKENGRELWWLERREGRGKQDLIELRG